MSVNPGRWPGSYAVTVAWWFAVAMVLAGTLVLGFYGIHRSLWLDEAWVANSVRQPTLGAMFHYSEWLQTSPPLFLMVTRSAVALFGLSIETLRSVPVGFALVAAIAMLAAFRRAVGWPWAVFATTVMMFSPGSIEHFRSFKQYGGEVAATAATLYIVICYLQSRTMRDFLLLCVMVAGLLTLSYPLVFLSPGLLAAVWFTSPTRAMGLAAVVTIVELGLYRWFIRPNVAPDLWTFWNAGWHDVFSLSISIAVVFCAAVAFRIARDRPRDWRWWMQVVCLTSCGGFLVAEIAGLYPTDPRMRLFLWPCLLMLAAMQVEDLFARLGPRISRVIPIVAAGLALSTMAWGIHKTFAEHRDQDFEGYRKATAYLHSHLGPDDLLLVHADAREGFLLQVALDRWADQDWLRQTRFGNTGWPCCARGHVASPGSSRADAVTADLAEMVLSNFKGRVWLVYGNRTLHWQYLGLDEGDLWRRTMWERGCPPIEYLDMGNLVVSPMACGTR